MIGAVVLSTEQGLGYLAKDFYDHGLIQKVLIHPHSSRTNHPGWFPNGKLLLKENYDWFFEGLEAIIYFEEPFDWHLIPEARKRGIKNIFIPMYECTRNPMPYEPDLIICPSLLDLEYYKDKNAVFLPIPVEKQWRLHSRALVFVHNAGNGGLGGRNGTKELVEAMKYVKSPLKLIIRSQVPLTVPKDNRIDLRIGTFDDIWDEGDVFVFPEKFNGLSLPIQEAFASGMMVMCGNRFPMNDWLPNQPLIPVKGYKKERISVEFDSAIIDPVDIAKCMDRWYDEDIEFFSLEGKAWAQENSWRKLKPIYEKYIKG